MCLNDCVLKEHSAVCIATIKEVLTSRSSHTNIFGTRQRLHQRDVCLHWRAERDNASQTALKRPSPWQPRWRRSPDPIRVVLLASTWSSTLALNPALYYLLQYVFWRWSTKPSPSRLICRLICSLFPRVVLWSNTESITDAQTGKDAIKHPEGNQAEPNYVGAAHVVQQSLFGRWKRPPIRVSLRSHVGRVGETSACVKWPLWGGLRSLPFAS